MNIENRTKKINNNKLFEIKHNNVIFDYASTLEEKEIIKKYLDLNGWDIGDYIEYRNTFIDNDIFMLITIDRIREIESQQFNNYKIIVNQYIKRELNKIKDVLIKCLKNDERMIILYAYYGNKVFDMLQIDEVLSMFNDYIKYSCIRKTFKDASGVYKEVYDSYKNIRVTPDKMKFQVFHAKNSYGVYKQLDKAVRIRDNLIENNWELIDVDNNS